LVRKGKIKVLSDFEERLLDTIASSVSVKEACRKLRISPKTAYNALYRLRRKYMKARAFVNKYDAQKRRSRLLKMVLTSRIEPEEEVEEEEELEEVLEEW